MMNPVYNYTEEGEGGLTITGDTEECVDFFLAFNADGAMAASEDCNLFILATDDFTTFGNEDVYVSFMEDSVMFGSTVTGSNFTIEGVTTEVNDDGDTVLTTDDGTMTFTVDGSVAFASNDPDADVLTMMNPVYNYTEEGEGGLTITGDTEECADFFLAFNADGAMVASEDCGFLAAVDGDVGLLLTDDSFTVGNEDAYISFMEDSVMFGSTVTGSNFTVDVDVTETDDDGIMMTYDEGSTTFTADDTVVLASSDPNADTLTINNPVYNYTDDAFIISGDIEGCDDFTVAFNTSGGVYGSEDCGFITGVDLGTGDAFFMTDDVIAFGNGDEYVAFMEDSVVFGSTSTGSNFTIDADVTETDDEGIMMTYDEGSTTFTADDTVVLASSDPDADTLTINNP